MKKLLFIALFFSFINCGEEENTEIYKPSAIGTQGIVNIVMDNVLWEGRLGEIVKDKIAPMIEYYPNQEYLFDLIHSTKKEFNMSSKKQRNIIEFTLNKSENIEPNLTYSSDIWASGQSIIKIIGRNQQDLYDLFISHSQEIQDHFMKLEIEQLKSNLMSSPNYLAKKQLLDSHNLSLTVPVDMSLIINNSTFAAFEQIRLVSEKQTNPGDVQQFVIVYHYPYTDKNQLTKEYLLNKRDSITKQYFRGVGDDSYMITAPDSLVPSFEKEVLFKGNYAFEIRGLYSMVNDFRGGPFVNISVIDEARKRIITIEGHVFAPKFNKRSYMMELETILNTLTVQ
mgnify:CR=1 FL=1